MSAEQARIDIAGIVAAITAAWTAYPLLVSPDNRTSVDYAKQVKPFLQIDTEFLSADQLDISETPVVRQYGQLILSVVIKEGAGLAEVTRLSDFIVPFVERKDLVALHTGIAEIHKPKTLRGMVYYPILTNFYYHR